MTDPPIMFGMKTRKKRNVHLHAKVQLSLAALVGSLHQQGMEGMGFETLQSCSITQGRWAEIACTAKVLRRFFLFVLG